MPHFASLPFAWSVLARTGIACAVGFAMAVLCAPWCIRRLKQFCAEPVKSASAELNRLHGAKSGTPTMGGVLIIGCFLVVLLLVGKRSEPTLPLVALTAGSLCLLGCVDDWVKVRTARRGLTARTKLIAQLLIAVVVGSLLFVTNRDAGSAAKLCLPLVGSFDMGWWFVPWAALVIVGSSNAVNLADGLDGLAGGCMLLALAAMSLVALIAGHESSALLVGIPFVPGAAEMAVVGGTLAGTIAAFLLFNRHPAALFMGDAGSLPLGGVLGLLALVLRQELLLLLVGGVFVAEALSVIVQVGWFRLTGRRVFRCAPLHHHFQFRGLAEKKIVARFWLAGAVCAVVGLSTLASGAKWPAATRSDAAEWIAARRQSLPATRGQELPPRAELFR